MSKIIKRAGGILIKDKKVLICKANNQDFYLLPGGSVDAGETVTQALVRELSEELQIEVQQSDLEPFDESLKPADQVEDFDLHLVRFIVKKWSGEIKIANEIEEIAWIDSTVPENIKLGSIFESEVLPKLKLLNLVS